MTVLARDGVAQVRFTPAGDLPAHDGQRARVVTVTPETAAAWIAVDVRKRKVRAAKVAEMARDMRAGNWTLNGETVKRAADGGIIDGIHRLTAVIESGTAIETWLVEGLSPEAQDTVDLGTPRSMGDQLALRGTPDAVLLGAVTKRAWRWIQGRRSVGGPNPTHAEMDLMIGQVPLLTEATAFAARARKEFPVIRATVYGLCYLIFSEKSSLDAQVFLGHVISGTDLEDGHPAVALRRRAIQAAGYRQRRLLEHEQVALTVMAWNAYREGRRIAHVQLPAGGLKPSNFPEPK